MVAVLNREFPTIANLVLQLQGHAALHHAKNPWTEKEDALLRDAYVRVTAESMKDVVPWHKIAELVPTRTGKQCRERWIHHLRPHVDKSDWTPAEDQIIFNKVCCHYTHMYTYTCFLV
jgi:hypothetical protein